MNDTTALSAGVYAQRPAPGLAGAGGRVLWWRALLVAGLMVALFWPNLVRLWLKTNPVTGEANWAHSLFVPLIGLYYLYLNREALLTANERRKPASALRRAIGAWVQLQIVFWGIVFFIRAYYPPSFIGTGRRMMFGTVLGLLGVLTAGAVWMATRRGRSDSRLRRIVAALTDRAAGWFGFYLMLWGMVLFAWAIYPGRNDFLKDVGMVATIFGVVLLLCGWAVMRVAWFPIVFLVVGVPWPELFYSRVAMPLQKGAASAAVSTLRATGVDAEREGTIIIIRKQNRSRQLNVAEACAGLKSLMTFIAVGATIGFLSSPSRQMWQRLLITLSAVPIAVLANMMRVAGQGLLDHYVSERLSESFAHQFVGLVMLIPALLLMMAMAWIVDRMVVEEVESRSLGERPAAQRNAELVIEIPRTRRSAGAAKGALAEPAPAAPSEGPGGVDDLAAATQRLMALRESRRRSGAPEAPGIASGANGEEEK